MLKKLFQLLNKEKKKDLLIHWKIWKIHQSSFILDQMIKLCPQLTNKLKLNSWRYKALMFTTWLTQILDIGLVVMSLEEPLPTFMRIFLILEFCQEIRAKVVTTTGKANQWECWRSLIKNLLLNLLRKNMGLLKEEMKMLTQNLVSMGTFIIQTNVLTNPYKLPVNLW